ncbi:hypothetical protein POL68_32120 [Stigmatella sp. ncwal1]|uniref:DUF397 domain-containing protein n=1 Tax=Stigmatella ashevillensis TaxID=2995309 RepID=A0ABT5DHL5_9BACT|nr:hypothetical protein [Stigmatella ashevillena]MDC0713152.1 hypothetical protein [Stigmatella ashevillena]
MHLRPGDAYQRLVALDQEAVEGSRPAERALLLEDGPQVALLASASSWRAMVEHGCALSMDVGLGTLPPHQEPSSRGRGRPLSHRVAAPRGGHAGDG